MSTLQLTVPVRKTGESRLKLRPREIGEWLDDLPYLDIRRASRSASEQLRLMNRRTIVPAVRLMILENFLAAWQRLNDSLPADPIEANAIRPTLNRMCQDAGFGYKIVVDELVNHPSGFMELRHLPQALLGAVYTLGLQQLNYYQNHKRVPRALWKECLDLFFYAQEHGRAQHRGQLPGIGVVQIDECFKLVTLIRLSDPYSMPAGLITPLEHYFRRHIQLARLSTSPREKNEQPGTIVKLRQAQDEGQLDHLSVDLSELVQQLSVDVGRLKAGCQPADIGLPVETPTSVVIRSFAQLLKHWKQQARRKDERESVHSAIELVSGLEVAYCMLNKGRCFDPSMFLDPGAENDIDLGALPSPAPAADRTIPEPLRCHCSNRSNGGLAIDYRGSIHNSCQPQAGQLLAVRRPGTRHSQSWVVGLCRWMIETANDQGFDLGFQYVARQPRAAVIRIHGQDGTRAVFQPAITARQKRGERPVQTLITATGQLTAGNEIDLYERAEPQRIRCLELLDSGAGFERYLYETM